MEKRKTNYLICKIFFLPISTIWHLAFSQVPLQKGCSLLILPCMDMASNNSCSRLFPSSHRVVCSVLYCSTALYSLAICRQWLTPHFSSGFFPRSSCFHCFLKVDDPRMTHLTSSSNEIYLGICARVYPT